MDGFGERRLDCGPRNYNRTRLLELHYKLLTKAYHCE